MIWVSVALTLAQTRQQQQQLPLSTVFSSYAKAETGFDIRHDWHHHIYPDHTMAVDVL
jgi:hypothetical protein